MKKLILSALAISAFAFISCNEDDDNSVNEFSGKWSPIKTIINGEESSYSGHASCGQDYLILNDFLTYEMKDFQNLEVFNPDTNEIETICEEKGYTGSYRIQSQNITFYGGTFLSGGQLSISGNELRIKSFADVNADGETDEVVTVFQKN